MADLQHRYDSKFLVRSDQLATVLDALSADLAVLDIEGERLTRYESVYFDTPDLRTYHDHLKRRRRRFKIRTRRYHNTPGAMLEVKCKGRRGQTIKHRWVHGDSSPDHLGPHSLALIQEVLFQQYGMSRPSDLRASATTTFERVTLVRPNAGTRVTIDIGLEARTLHGRVTLGAKHFVVETKERTRGGGAERALNRIGRQPGKISKYCLSLAALDPNVRANPWRPALKELLSAGDPKDHPAR
ncbi:MAG: VTC domain-containing protein [Nitriliruptoraceae bacterium]|nr:VTC domain-containing protein [Nitriliruptoraceae bacterium]